MITRHTGGRATLRAVRVRRAPANPGTRAARWLPLHRLALGEGLQWGIYLDDLDPFRDCHGARTSARLDARAIRRWRDLIEEAWSLLRRLHPHYAEAIGAGLTSIVPLRAMRGSRGGTATSPDSFGSCLMSEPADALSLAVGLVHEFQHAKLGALMDMLPLHTADRAARYYAPWRDDPRPLGGLLHGTYAFAAVTDFWRVQRTVTPPARAAFAHFEFARWRDQTLLAARTLQASGYLTELGSAVVTALRDRLLGWARDDVPDEAAGAARQSVADHEVSWRLRHLQPAADPVRQIADAWLAGQPCPPGCLAPPQVRAGGPR